jgi:hypothetical protein
LFNKFYHRCSAGQWSLEKIEALDRFLGHCAYVLCEQNIPEYNSEQKALTRQVQTPRAESFSKEIDQSDLQSKKYYERRI